MAQMWEPCEVFSFNHDALVAGRVKAIPIARKLAALWRELRPSLSTVERVSFFFVGARIVVDDKIGYRAQIMFAHQLDQSHKLCAIAVGSFGRSLLIKVPKV